MLIFQKKKLRLRYINDLLKVKKKLLSREFEIHIGVY